MMESNNVLGENIKKKMEEKNLTTFELADRLNITTVELSRYINGKRVPKAPLIFHMARELDCTADELMGIENAIAIEIVDRKPICKSDMDPGEPTIQAVIEWLKCRAQNVTMAGARKMFLAAAAALKEQDWIPVSKGLPKTTDPVNVTWTNNDPAPYYADIKGKRFTACAHYHRGKWWWYSSVCQDLLDEYGSGPLDDEVDEAIEIIAWKPIGEPYTEKEQ